MTMAWANGNLHGHDVTIKSYININGYLWHISDESSPPPPLKAFKKIWYQGHPHVYAVTLVGGKATLKSYNDQCIYCVDRHRVVIKNAHFVIVAVVLLTSPDGVYASCQILQEVFDSAV